MAQTSQQSSSASDASDAAADTDLKRGLSARHMQMIAIGGAIGTGLFVASGKTISTAGPGGAIVAYGLIGIMVLFLMQSLGEMAAHLPVPGSFQTYATRYVSSSFGFAMGWNYWFNWAITVAAELVAVGEVMKYWLPETPSWVWAGIFLVLLTGLNALSAKAYGEGEFWLATIKVVVAGFSFQGTEMIGIAAGESKNPRRDVPRALTSVFWRIMLFYIGAMVIIGFLIPYTDPNLLTAAEGDINISPFTLIFERAGIAFAAAAMNAVILTAVLSAGNSGLYVSARMLFSLAQEGKAPKIFTKVNKGGVPMPALMATSAVGAIGFIASVISPDAAYLWLVNVSGLAGFITWVGIAVAHYRFRRAYMRQGHNLNDLPYTAPFFPVGPIIAFIMCLLVIGGQNYEAILAGDWVGVMSSYIGLPVFVAVWAIHAIVTRDRLIPLEQVDVSGLEVKTSK